MCFNNVKYVWCLNRANIGIWAKIGLFWPLFVYSKGLNWANLIRSVFIRHMKCIWFSSFSDHLICRLKSTGSLTIDHLVLFAFWQIKIWTFRRFKIFFGSMKISWWFPRKFRFSGTRTWSSTRLFRRTSWISRPTRSRYRIGFRASTFRARFRRSRFLWQPRWWIRCWFIWTPSNQMKKFIFNLKLVKIPDSWTQGHFWV